MKLRPLPLLHSVLIALLLGACSAPQTVERQERISPPYQVMVRALGPASVSDDGFDARFEFEVVSPLDLHRNSLVQELKQTITFEYEDGSTRERQLTLVEAFRLRLEYVDAARQYHYRIYAGQSDRHSMRGMNDLPDDVTAVRISRRVFAYVANVVGADFTDAGFAHLPRNEDGTVVSEIPEKFNSNYQSKHVTRGSVANSGDSLGLTYRINYRLVRNSGDGPQFVVDRGGGYGVVEAPAVVWVPDN
ncbi:MAG: hypothetical protein KDB90_10300 [Planctomycetes bacterium]|nr:hypothetical protein [Planctomycetota bacterium]